MILDLDPYLVRFGDFGIRWYGFFMALSMAAGLYYMLRNGIRRGYTEDYLYSIGLLAIGFGLVGARALYVLTNWNDYATNLAEIPRIDHGGLAWHGGLLGGLLAGFTYVRLKPSGRPAGVARAVWELADLTVPGLALGYMLVRIGNIFNGELIGRVAEMLPFERHPAQIYGSAIGLVLLIIYFRQKRLNPPPGHLFWSFIFYFSVLRGFVEETVRSNPLFLIRYVNTNWGIGFTTMTQLFTPALIVFAYLMRRYGIGPARKSA